MFLCPCCVITCDHAIWSCEHTVWSHVIMLYDHVSIPYDHMWSHVIILHDHVSILYALLYSRYTVSISHTYLCMLISLIWTTVLLGASLLWVHCWVKFDLFQQEYIAGYSWCKPSRCLLEHSTTLYRIMQIVRSGKVSRLHGLLVIRGKIFTIVQQFETPYNKKEKICWKPLRLEANLWKPRKFSTVNDLHYMVSAGC